MLRVIGSVDIASNGPFLCTIERVREEISHSMCTHSCVKWLLKNLLIVEVAYSNDSKKDISVFVLDPLVILTCLCIAGHSEI